MERRHVLEDLCLTGPNWLRIQRVNLSSNFLTNKGYYPHSKRLSREPMDSTILKALKDGHDNGCLSAGQKTEFGQLNSRGQLRLE